MQTIFKQKPVAPFTQIENSLIDCPMPSAAKNVLLYLLSKPHKWKLNITNVINQLGLTRYSVRKALQWLQQAGYVYYERLKTGHTIWFIYDKPAHCQIINLEIDTPQATPPESPVISPQVEKPQVENRPLLEIIKKQLIKKPQPPTPTPKSDEVVVVVDKVDLIFPETLTESQINQARCMIKKFDAKLQQDILIVLADAITRDKVKQSPIAYLNGLVTRANNNSFEPLSPPKIKPVIPCQKPTELPKVDNNAYFADLLKKYGNKAVDAITKTNATYGLDISLQTT